MATNSNWQFVMFRISLHENVTCGENFSTFLHRHCLWCLWQISGMVKVSVSYYYGRRRLSLSLSQHFLFVSNGFSSKASRLFHQIRVASFLPAPSMETYFSFFAALLSHILLLPILPHLYCPTKTIATNKQTSTENKDNKQAWKCNKHNKQTDPSYKQIQQAYPHIPGRLCSFPAVLLRLLSFVNSWEGGDREVEFIGERMG